MTATDEELQRLANHRMVVRQCARRYRARRRNGARCLRIEISNAEQTLDAFVKIGVLEEERRNDNRAIEAAISALCQRGYSAIKAERETDRDNNRSGNPFATFRHSKVDELAIPPLKLLPPSLERGTPPLPPSSVRYALRSA